MLSITEFCQSNEHCSLYKNGHKLYPMQELILRQFYGENLSQSEIAKLHGRFNTAHMQGKHDYNLLVALLGRRSGKDMLTCIIVAYETYRLLCLENPFKYFGIASGNPIYVSAIQPSSDQARILFTNLKELFLESPFFKERISHVDGEKVYFRVSDNSHAICTAVFNANSESLLGKGMFSIVFNEAAWYKTDRLYSALAPSTASFIKDGKPQSRICVLTTPRRENDWVYNLYKSERPTTLTVKLPTWEINPCNTKEQLREASQPMTEDEFLNEFGAEFITDINATSTVSMRFANSTIDRLKRIAREIAYNEDRDVSYLDLVRDAIEEYIVRNTIG